MRFHRRFYRLAASRLRQRHLRKWYGHTDEDINNVSDCRAQHVHSRTTHWRWRHILHILHIVHILQILHIEKFSNRVYPLRVHPVKISQILHIFNFFCLFLIFWHIKMGGGGSYFAYFFAISVILKREGLSRSVGGGVYFKVLFIILDISVMFCISVIFCIFCISHTLP